MALSTQTSSSRINREETKSPDLQSFLYGKMPPQNLALERAVLGAVMIEKGTFDIVSEILHPVCFYDDRHQKIFAAFEKLFQQSKPIDILTVEEQLRVEKELDIVGGSFYLIDLTQDVSSTAHIEHHARVILEKFIQRELMSASSAIIGKASIDTDDIFNLMTFAEDEVFKITQNYLKGDYKKIGQILVDVDKRIGELRKSSEKISGVYSGYASLDNITHGWQPTDLIILAARPSVGKTAYALNLALRAAQHAKRSVPIGIFSLEMSSEQLVQRLLANQSRINLGKLLSGNLAEHEVVQMQQKGIVPLSETPLYIDDTPALNSFELRAKTRRMVKKHGVGMIIIDYLQLMQASGENKSYNREQEISKISRDLKSLAKDLRIPIIALSQLNRMVETRKENKIPQLSDLRESGAIEQDADLVMFLYRPEMYEQTEDEAGESLQGATFLKIAKHRNGTLTDGAGLRFHFNSGLQLFEEDSHSSGIGWEKPLPSHRQPPPSAQLYIAKSSSMNRRSSSDQHDPF